MGPGADDQRKVLMVEVGTTTSRNIRGTDERAAGFPTGDFELVLTAWLFSDYPQRHTRIPLSKDIYVCLICIYIYIYKVICAWLILDESALLGGWRNTIETVLFEISWRIVSCCADYLSALPGARGHRSMAAWRSRVRRRAWRAMRIYELTPTLPRPLLLSMRRFAHPAEKYNNKKMHGKTTTHSNNKKQQIKL